MGTCASTPQNPQPANPDDVLVREVEIDRKESMLRPMVQNRNGSNIIIIIFLLLLTILLLLRPMVQNTFTILLAWGTNR